MDVIHLFVLFEYQCHMHCLDMNVIAYLYCLDTNVICLFVLFTHESHVHDFLV
jgi:hypothetical protein